ncbi:bacteriohemerythrin, partial [bacterium]|nr:bacteriohemerythrin [bacterium]
SMTSDQTAAASEELAAQAMSLKEMMLGYRFEDGDNAARPVSMAPVKKSNLPSSASRLSSAQGNGNAREKKKDVFIQWSDSMSVNQHEIDQQHKRLFELVNQLYDAMKAGQGTNNLSRILKELIRYTKNHFSAEEQYMEKAGYPKLEAHKKIHEGFAMKVLEFQRAFESGEVVLSQDILDFLKEWLVNHIMKQDQEYAPYLGESYEAVSPYQN